MRHRHAGRSFGRTSSHRKAMFANLCNALVEHELIKTTLPKAKELRRYIEPLVSKSKSDSVVSRRYVFDKLRSKSAVGKLFTELGPRYQERPGGYVRILKCGYRHGDNAPMAIIEFVDRPEMVDLDEDEAEIQAELEKEKAAQKAKAKSEKPKAEAKVPKTEKKQAATKKTEAKQSEAKPAEEKTEASKAKTSEQPKDSAE